MLLFVVDIIITSNADVIIDFGKSSYCLLLVLI